MSANSSVSLSLADHVLHQVALFGVSEICVCPGGRNAEWIQALAQSRDFKVTWFYEERSAAFYALGRIKVTGTPVAVVTTSGTAAGELLPSAMEAYYSGLPLVLLTADRPRRFRGSGAPQTAEQVGLFGRYCPRTFDLEGDETCDSSEFATDAPTHINACFEDPNGSNPVGLIDSSPATLSEFLARCRMPLVVLGQLDPRDRREVLSFLKSLGAPVFVESLSGLRNRPAITPFRVEIPDKMLAHAGGKIDGVLRIGSVPTHRLWRDLEDTFAALPVLSITRQPFSGLARNSTTLVGDIAQVLRGADLPNNPIHICSELKDWNQRNAQLREDLLERYPRSEPALFRTLSSQIEPGSGIFLGNSLPIREWDFASSYTESEFEFSASRGLNGIDGQVSTFLGSCHADRPNWGILGDLTTLYDLSGPWPWHGRDHRMSASLVIVNNGGGKIFDRMFPSPEFQNRHSLSFESWAQMWSLPYQVTDDPREIPSSSLGLRVIELRPDADETRDFWNEFGARIS